MRYSIRWLKLLSPGILAGFISLFSTPAVALDLKVWEASINPHTKERYIPVELWAGAEWDGKRELKMPPVDGTYRHRTSTYYIKGPMDWKHPVTGTPHRSTKESIPTRKEAKTKPRSSPSTAIKPVLAGYSMAGQAETRGHIPAD